MSAFQMPASNRWSDFLWPDWVPDDARQKVEHCWRPGWGSLPRGPREWVANAVSDTAPAFGERLQMTSVAGKTVEGRYVHTHCQGLIVGDDGSVVQVRLPRKLGPWKREDVATEASRGSLVRGVTVSRTYALRFADSRYDWMNATVDDENDTLMISSDYGAWSYRWPRQNGETLSQAIASNYGVPYMAGKLCPESGAYDPDETRNAFKRLVLDYRRDESLDSAEARRVWGELDDVSWDNFDRAIEDLSFVQCADGSQVFDEPWEHRQDTPTAAYMRLRDAYLPALVDAVRAHLSATSPKADRLPSPKCGFYDPDPSGVCLTCGAGIRDEVPA